ncbi:MAG TPA: DDE transposase [Corynebacteriales bacterium]|jgi:hypothetical protein|nr:DDE transposase [Mycobacteriales bacterium]
MSFCRNISQQISFDDTLYGLTKREQKILKNSWAEEFSNIIFPLINEERFSVLYSSNPASRPNNPVNVYIGLLMLKDIFTLSDEEAIHSLYFDIRYQYALHTTSFEEQPVSKNTLTNFRSAVYKYNEQHGVDLIQEEIESHAKEFAKILNIDGRTIRMDSLMVSSSCKKLSRLEIIYSCVERLIKKIQKSSPEILSDGLKVYLEEGHRNDTIYRSRDKDIDSKLKFLIADAIELYNLCKDNAIQESEDFNTLARMLGEQTNNIDGKMELKASKEISSNSLQNPTDPDATYRTKGKKKNIGYVANIVESFDDDDKIITQYDLKQNIYSDQKFSKDTINKLGKQDKKTNILVDGAYYSHDLSNEAKDNNISLIPTGLVGRTVNEENAGFENFGIDEKEQVVSKCPMGHKPVKSTFKKGKYTAHFAKETCDSCPNFSNCPLKSQKKRYFFQVTQTKLHRAKIIAEMKTDEYKKVASKRAGVEGIPSVLRRRYNIDHLPVRGLVRSKVHLGLKISAINCKRLIKSRLGSSRKALISLLYKHLLEIFCFQRSVTA